MAATPPLPSLLFWSLDISQHECVYYFDDLYLCSILVNHMNWPFQVFEHLESSDTVIAFITRAIAFITQVIAFITQAIAL